MKNVFWAILGVLAIVAIVFIKKDGGDMNKDGAAATPSEMSKVYVDGAGQKLMVTIDTEKAQVSFGPVGSVTLKSSTANLSGITYTNQDETLVFWDKGLTANLTQNGEVIFEGSLQENGSN
jgi:membrane-bound inhibitor of C-type lysozyme